MYSVLVFFPGVVLTPLVILALRLNERVSVGESSAHTHTIYSLFSSAQTLLRSPRPRFFFFLNENR